MGENPKKRVVLVLATSTGGVGQHVCSVAANLLAMGNDVTVCGPAATDERFGFSSTGARFRPVGIASGIDPVADARAVLALRKAVIDADIVHAHGYRAGFVSLIAMGSPRARRRLVVTWHNILMAQGIKRAVLGRIEKTVARNAAITLGVSSELVRRAISLGAKDARFTPVVAPPLAPPVRNREEVRRELGVGDGPMLLTVGRLHPQKSHDVLIEAAARWTSRSPVPHVFIAGSGPQEAELAALIDRLAAPVRLLGHRSDMADLIQACDLAVVTSQWEGRPLFAQELLQAGKPVVTTAVGGTPELVGDGAVLVPPHDVDAVDKAVTALLDDPVALDELAQRGKAQAATWPTEVDIAEQVSAVYEELLGLVP